ncbi:serine/threonine-protein kinase [Geodermatophilus sp. FMUSA9-8]|uniref:serine/threonine-protein kinase n=1 Tax=Geodermatophilus sp. FMUSA9-8 TaxID=3120155 RepID=UPI003008EDF0
MTGSVVRRVVGGRYELLGLIATGGMGQVWHGRDTLLDRPVAVKLLRGEYSGDATIRSRFRTEARLAGRLAHRNIAALFDYGEEVSDAGEVCAHLVMELVDGESLSSLLTREGRLPAGRVLDLVGQTAAGLGAAHAAGVVHRDVKPGNLLVGRDGVVRITDFGVAWSAGSAPLTGTGQVVGTAHYLAPEQAAGGKAGPASDVYALGMVAWECLAGHRAFEGDNPVQIALRQLREDPAPLPADVPAPVRDLVARMLAKDPAGRPADGAELAAVVEAVRAGRPLPPAPPPGTAPLPLPLGAVAPAPPPPPPRRRAVRALAVAGTLAAGAVLGIGALQLTAPGAGTPPAAVADAAPAGVDVRRDALAGRPADEVEDELVAAGLRVTRVTQDDAATAAGTVLAVTPVGALAAGDLVTLTVAVAPPVPSSAPAPVPAPAPSPVTVTVPVPVEVPAPGWEAPPVAEQPQPPAEVPPAPEGPGDGPGNGQGNGNGNGNGSGSGNGNAGGNGGGNGNGRGRG